MVLNLGCTLELRGKLKKKEKKKKSADAWNQASGISPPEILEVGLKFGLGVEILKISAMRS